MTAQTIAELVHGVFLCGEENAEREVRYAFSADLMSDVLTLTHDDVLFITGLVAPQTIRTAVVSDISIILFVRNKSIPTSIIDIARENDITVISSPFTMYRAGGILFQAGLEAIY